MMSPQNVVMSAKSHEKEYNLESCIPFRHTNHILDLRKKVQTEEYYAGKSNVEKITFLNI